MYLFVYFIILFNKIKIHIKYYINITDNWSVYFISISFVAYQVLSRAYIIIYLFIHSFIFFKF